MNATRANTGANGNIHWIASVIWAVALFVITVACGYVIVRLLENGTEDDASRTPSTVAGLTDEATLRILPQVPSQIRPVEQVAETAVRQGAAEHLAELTELAAANVESAATITVASAASAIRESSVDKLEPSLQLQDLSQPQATAGAIIDSVLHDLSLQPTEVSDESMLQLKLGAATALSIDDVIAQIEDETDRESLRGASDIVQQATVAALATSISEGLITARDNTVDKLPEDTKAEINEKPTGPLDDGREIGYLTVVSGIAALTLAEFLALLTSLVHRLHEQAARREQT